MIIRKPYAFLIKNFKKIHLAMLLLCIYIFYRQHTVSAFVREFMDLGVYNEGIDPISNYTTWLSYLALLFVIGFVAALIVLLKKKEKPWKLYSIILIGYAFIFVVLVMTQQYFNNFTGAIDSATIRAISDLLFISSLSQYAAFIILMLRILGADLNKFNFHSDEEFLELSEEDREEFEVRLDIDKQSVKRKFNKFRRNLKYFYVEHKFISNAIIVAILLIAAGYSYYYIAVVNRSYQEGTEFVANGFSIQINETFYTETNLRGERFSDNRGFVIVEMTITNLASRRREMDMQMFHMMSGNSRSNITMRYNNDFLDFGVLYLPRVIESGQSLDVLLAFPIDTELSNDRFALYKQEIHSASRTHLRRIRLNPVNLTTQITEEPVTLGERLTFEFANQEDKNITIDRYQIVENAEYTRLTCPREGCRITRGTLTAPEGFKILNIEFISRYFSGEEFVDFSIKYGRIRYIGEDGMENFVDFNNFAGRGFTGNELFVRVPSGVMDSNVLELVYTIRNREYTVVLR